MTRSRRPHGLVYALLAVSLAVNLIGAGYYLGSGFTERQGAKHARQPRTVESTIDFVSSRYPKPVAAAVKAKLEERREQVKVALDEMRAARRDTRKAIKEEPLDKARVEAAFGTAREKAEVFQRIVQQAVMDALPDLPPSERGQMDKDDDPE